MARAKPTAKSLQELRELGYDAGVVERTIPYSYQKVDLFNFADIVAIKSGSPILAIQATGGSNHSNRVEKIHAEYRARVWIEAGGEIEVWSVAKRCRIGANGKRLKQKTWQIRKQKIELSNIVSERSDPIAAYAAEEIQDAEAGEATGRDVDDR